MAEIENNVSHGNNYKSKTKITSITIIFEIWKRIYFFELKILKREKIYIYTVVEDGTNNKTQETNLRGKRRENIKFTKEKKRKKKKKRNTTK